MEKNNIDSSGNQTRGNRKRLWVAGVSLLALLGIGFWLTGRLRGAHAGSIPTTVDFNYHVRPILADRCFKCHGPDSRSRKAGLRLDTEEGLYAALKDNPSAHVTVAGSPELSEIYQRISSEDTAYLMPPPSSNLALSPDEVKIIKKWISQGATYKKHWAFIKPEKPAVPSTGNDGWCQNDIDHFTLKKMEEKGLSPNPESDPERLLRRLCLDLTGLPPEIALQDRFLKDPSLSSYEKIVDELLARPQFGEKMAAGWLDLARYADSHGYQDDGLRTMWPFRDWVIHAFNSNYPYDKFVTWQLAGDLLPSPTTEQLLASGFNRNHKITQEGGVIDEEYRVEYVSDRTNTFSKAFLAMTMECAKCHDHKYDPISQRDYYSTFAFFNQVNEKGLYGDISIASPGDPPNMFIRTAEAKTSLPFLNLKDTGGVTVMVMRDSSVQRVTRLLRRGVYDQAADTMPFSPPRSILPFDTSKYAKNRLGLAKWLFDPSHPLTARVYVNRLWQEFFGRGLVRTVGDFGLQGDLPSHPELLDWLASDFMQNGWDIKRMIRLLVTSSTYKQSAKESQKQVNTDPENIWLSRSARSRLIAETVRDQALSSSGLMNREIGGPSVKPYQPAGIWEASTSGRGILARYEQDHGDKLYRRGLYTFIKRTAPPPSMLIFDGGNRDICEVRRMRTNTPLQALVQLNDPQLLEAARVMSQKLMEDKILNPTDRLKKAFRLVVCRMPTDKELKQMEQYLASETDRFRSKPEMAEALLKNGESPQSKEKDRGGIAALMETIQILFNLDETLTRP
jgi:hypothetical protein